MRLLPLTTSLNSEGGLVIGGVDICDAATQHGTPAFFYDRQHLRQRATEAATAFDIGTSYASKAFFCKAMARLMTDAGLFLDVASGGEAYTALAAGIPGSRCVLHGNNKSIAELRYALENHFHRIVVDCEEELERIELLNERYGYVAPILIRVNPGVEAHTHEYVQTGQSDSKFGFSLVSGAAEACAKRVRDNPAFSLMGIHVHIGSQIFDTTSFSKAIGEVGPFFQTLGLDEFVIGGGLGVPYMNDEPSISIAEWAATARQGAADAGISPKVRLIAEPGRAIAAAAAITVYRVGAIKDMPAPTESGMRSYLSVNGGMSDNPRPVLYGSGYEAFLVRDVAAPRTRAVRIVGKHCESGDVLVRDALLPESTIVGDLIATPVTGAYGYSMASNYNRMPKPPVIFCHNGVAEIVVRRQTYEDLLSLDV